MVNDNYESVDFEALIDYDDEHLILWPQNCAVSKPLQLKLDLVYQVTDELPPAALKVHAIVTRDGGMYQLSMYPLDDL